ncbi:MAG: hypothetical protein L6R38_005141 [Xanthoria sp. 2 TBL-2021]|nr:MAG: hypothetical protein L6R38_005141 [Xanthoria sp. 2 TBL-2021]
MLTLRVGVAAGAGQSFSSILALNVRTEIAFGMFSDGCTALSWKDGNTSLLAQNWDWQQEQEANLIRLRIKQVGKPNIDMITEAGIIGKIGLNSAGVGVCLNATRAEGVDFGRLPCHLVLRRCLDSNSRAEAIAALKEAGVASSCHILVADLDGGTGIECSSADIILIPMCDKGRVIHTNHFVHEHPGVEENVLLKDSEARLARISVLVKTATPDVASIRRLLEDEDGYPISINRQRTHESTIATLFSIVMRLDKGYADVRMGRPTEADQYLKLQPDLKDV